MVSDARQALSQQSDSMKALYLLGVALREQGAVADAIPLLTKAVEAAREQGDSGECTVGDGCCRTQGCCSKLTGWSCARTRALVTLLPKACCDIAILCRPVSFASCINLHHWLLIHSLWPKLKRIHTLHATAVKDDIWRELAKAKYASWQAESAARAAEQADLRERLRGLLQQQPKQEGLKEELARWDRLFEQAAASDRRDETPSAFTCELIVLLLEAWAGSACGVKPAPCEDELGYCQNLTTI